MSDHATKLLLAVFLGVMIYMAMQAITQDKSEVTNSDNLTNGVQIANTAITITSPVMYAVLFGVFVVFAFGTLQIILNYGK